ncbi:MAG: ABC transporter permease, partial [Candidatus Bipolaricaulia bacterium]
VHVAPGSPVHKLVNPRLSEQAKQEKIEELGLDKPIYVQYLVFLKNIFTGDFGKSLYTEKSVRKMIAARIGNTAALGLTGLGLAFIVGVPVGILAATYKGGAVDLASMTMALLGIALPRFWLGLLLILIFSIQFDLLPAAGIGSIAQLILPAFTLSASVMAYVARVTRSSILESLTEDFVTTARAKGLRERAVLFKHTLRNALDPVVAMFGLQFGWLIGGAVTVEYVFSRPGLGRLMISSIYSRDYPVVQALIVILGISVVLGNLFGDVILALINPKVRHR